MWLTAPSDFLVTVDWGDGTNSAGIVIASTGGGFDIVASRPWNVPGIFTMTLHLSDNLAATAVAGATVTVTPRVLSATAPALTVEKGTTFSGTLATFTDNLAGTTAASYQVTITWSDGLSTVATITQNPDGSFAISTSPFSLPPAASRPRSPSRPPTTWFPLR